MKNLKTLSVSLFISLSILGCSDINNEINPLAEAEKQLSGNWVEKEPYNGDGGMYYGGDDGIRDTLILTKNNTVELYFPLVGWNYKLVNMETILFFNEKTKEEKRFSFSLNENREITIYNFVDRSATERIKNITFIRHEELK